jgi:hypothetical protein
MPIKEIKPKFDPTMVVRKVVPDPKPKEIKIEEVITELAKEKELDDDTLDFLTSKGETSNVTKS